MDFEKHSLTVYLPKVGFNWRAWLPSRGNAIFTLLMIGLLIWTQSAGALPLPASLRSANTSTGTIAYQGRLADADGNPLTDTVNMEFRLYDAASGGVPLWEKLWTGANAVQVSDGLFNVMLGSLVPIDAAIISANDTLYLGITAGTDDEMSPRVQLGTVPFAVQALTVPDGSVTTEKIADGAVTQAQAPFAAKAYLANGSTISKPNDLESLAITYVFTLEGGATAENFRYDISSLEFSGRPYAVCQLVNVGVHNEFCHADWDGSTNESLLFQMRRYDGGTVGSGLRRVNIILFGH